jgi:hypothetical protein
MLVVIMIIYVLPLNSSLFMFEIGLKISAFAAQRNRRCGILRSCQE